MKQFALCVLLMVASIGLAQTTYPGGTSSAAFQDVARDTLGWFNVRAYGAVGDGVASDSTAFKAAVTAAAAVFGTVYVPAGDYLVGCTIRIPSQVRIYMEPMALIRVPQGFADTLFAVSGQEATIDGGYLFEAGTPARNWIAVNMYSASASKPVQWNRVRNMHIYNARYGLDLYADNTSTAGWVNANSFEDVHFYNCVSFIRTRITAGCQISNNVFLNVSGQRGANTVFGLDSLTGSGNIFVGCTFYDFAGTQVSGFLTSNAVNTLFYGGTVSSYNFYDYGTGTTINEKDALVASPVDTLGVNNHPEPDTLVATIPTVTNGYTIIGIACYPNAMDSVVVDGTGGGKMDSLVTNISSNIGACLYGLKNLQAGTRTFYVYHGSGNNYGSIGVVTVAGVDQVSPVGTKAVASGTGTAATMAVTNRANEWVVDLCANASSRTMTPASGQGLQWKKVTGNDTVFGAMSVKNNPGFSNAWTLSASAAWRLAGVIVNKK